MDTLHEDVWTFTIISRWIILKMKNISDESCRENINTHFMFGKPFFQKSCRLWEIVGKYGKGKHARRDNITRRMRLARWIIKATATRSKYVILIAFPGQKWFSEAPQFYVICTLPVLFFSAQHPALVSCPFSKMSFFPGTQRPRHEANHLPHPGV